MTTSVELLMSAGSQIQMAPQGNLNSGQPVHSQDSNMSTGSSHSDKEVDPNTPEKVPRTPSERKRKRKADDSGGVVALVPGGKGPRTADNKKINDYFNKHAGTSPIRHGGSKSPSPQQGYPMLVADLEGHGAHLLLERRALVTQCDSGIAVQEWMLFITTGLHQCVGLCLAGDVTPVLPPPTIGTKAAALASKNCDRPYYIVLFPPSPQQTLLPSPVTPVTSVPPEFSSLMHLPRPLPVMASKLVQTELTCQRIQEFETQASSDLELRNNKIDELNRIIVLMFSACNFQAKTTEELRHQLTAQQKVIDQHKLHINKCIDVVKKLLKEKSNIEKKEARQKCMQNRLRLGQFVTQRVGATFQENWTDGYAFQELASTVWVVPNHGMADNIVAAGTVLPNITSNSLPGPSQGRNIDKRQKRVRPSSPIVGKIQEVVRPQPRFLIMSRVENNEDLKRVSPFILKRVINGAAKSEASIRKLRDGTIMIQTTTGTLFKYNGDL
uniref:Uncharacterized protein n=1 Tax=Timema poppense TaxID=170557 RepID=A0A7R9CW44_TIMPO|nr:unnamed protein product [Timema poppensis]